MVSQWQFSGFWRRSVQRRLSLYSAACWVRFTRRRSGGQAGAWAPLRLVNLSWTGRWGRPAYRRSAVPAAALVGALLVGGEKAGLKGGQRLLKHLRC